MKRTTIDDVNSIIGGNVVDITQLSYQKKYEWDSNDLIFEGFALPGALESDPAWIIMAHTYVSAKKVETLISPLQNGFNLRWDLRKHYYFGGSVSNSSSSCSSSSMSSCSSSFSSSSHSSSSWSKSESSSSSCFSSSCSSCFSSSSPSSSCSSSCFSSSCSSSFSSSCSSSCFSSSCSSSFSSSSSSST